VGRSRGGRGAAEWRPRGGRGAAEGRPRGGPRGSPYIEGPYIEGFSSPGGRVKIEVVSRFAPKIADT